jgi:hypothetical protein
MDLVYPLITIAFFASAALLLWLCQSLGGNP